MLSIFHPRFLHNYRQYFFTNGPPCYIYAQQSNFLTAEEISISRLKNGNGSSSLPTNSRRFSGRFCMRLFGAFLPIKLLWEETNTWSVPDFCDFDHRFYLM
jgi:hypothetical protein